MGSSIHGIFVKKAPTLTVGLKYDRVGLWKDSRSVSGISLSAM